ncbi:hypothetical protein R1sor_011874 [Riccia sorocarpa]|uniref:Uncharacterized protein n=1 Tax=Riccia sorocarpa TaxID=122646 RepID=A0ABD3I248_9MARC
MELAILKFLEEKDKPDARPWDVSTMSQRLAKFLKKVPQKWLKHYENWLISREFKSWTQDVVRVESEKPIFPVPCAAMRKDEEKEKWKRTAQRWTQLFQLPKSIKDHACISAKYKSCESRDSVRGSSTRILWPRKVKMNLRTLASAGLVPSGRRQVGRTRLRGLPLDLGFITSCIDRTEGGRGTASAYACRDSQQFDSARSRQAASIELKWGRIKPRHTTAEDLSHLIKPNLTVRLKRPNASPSVRKGVYLCEGLISLLISFERDWERSSSISAAQSNFLLITDPTDLNVKFRRYRDVILAICLVVGGEVTFHLL